ncbi:MAG TPA: hypothetical protein VHY84_17070 [Bryobacteraceae bacterium]|nr:hypothetical protein [Bryobacteraceae bacterium]
MKIAPIAQRINHLSSAHRFGELQEIRKTIKHLAHRPSTVPFDHRSIFDAYAFHVGGRKELQFNIGVEDEKLRYGVAFSFEQNRNFEEPEKVLLPHVARFNEYLSQDHERYARFLQWHVDHSDGGIRSEETYSRTIAPELIRRGNFIFFGALQGLYHAADGTIDYDRIDYETILNDFDDLLDLYIYVEGSVPALENISETTRFSFRAGCPLRAAATTASQAQASLDVSLRHNLLQAALHRELAAEFGEANVGVECRTSVGNVDLVVVSGQQYDLYEIKTAHEPRICIREALGQILEYACWPTPIPFRRLVIVGETTIDEDARRYVANLRHRYSLPISYRHVLLPEPGR